MVLIAVVANPGFFVKTPEVALIDIFCITSNENNYPSKIGN